MDVTRSDIELARERIRDAVELTPCVRSNKLSEQLGIRIHLKHEHAQTTGSYKERGALNRVLELDTDCRGVIASSAGNHGLGVARHAAARGIPVTIVMPLYTPLVKVTSVREQGASVVLHGDSFGDAYTHACELRDRHDWVFIHPFDDAHVIAGQGTVGLEILEQVPDVDTVVVPVGGGGLIAGISVAIRSVRPDVRIIGVESDAMPGMAMSLQEGSIVTVPARRTIADGIAVPRVGDRPFRIVKELVDRVVTVDDDEVASAVLTLLEVEKTVVEGASAAALAAVLHGDIRDLGERFVVVLTGGNIDVTLLNRIIVRGLVKDGRMFRFRARLPDTPGALSGMLDTLAQLACNIVDISHDRTLVSGDVREVEVGMTLETRGHPHIKEIVTSLTSAGISVRTSS